jgi:hypothetical protein
MKPTKKPAKSAKKKSAKPAPIAEKRALSHSPGGQRDTPRRSSARPIRDADTDALLDALNYGETVKQSIPAAAAAEEPPASELPLSLVSAPLSAEELAAERRQWRRGKLPGEKLIKINRQTGEFVVIQRDEWNRLY